MKEEEIVMMTSKELSEVMRVTTRTIHNWVLKGCPSFKVENTLRFDLDEVKAWMRQQKEVGG